MVVKFDKDTSTHPPSDPQVWYEVVVNNLPDRNYVYDIHIILTRESRVGCIILIVGTTHSNPSYTSYDFDEIIQKRI